MLRNGIKDSGCKFRLAYFRPASGLNEETRQLHAANLFAEVRQLHYSVKNDPTSPDGLRRAGKSLDLVLFLNGIPIFTTELKNPLTCQDVEDATRQYKTDRDPREPLFAYGRCIAHFAVDPDLVYVTTHLQGVKTRFLPFKQGKFGGAGNPPVPPTQEGYATAYLWEETWSRDSVLDLVRQFIHEVEEEDEKGRKTGRRFLIFPRYQQLDCVRRLVADARGRGAGAEHNWRQGQGDDRHALASARGSVQDRSGPLPCRTRLSFLEKLYVFARHLRRLLPADREELPREVQQNIDMESYRIQQTGNGRIALERNAGVLEPVSTKSTHGLAPEELETLSRIIAELNERFGLNLGPEHRVTLGQMIEKLDEDAALDAAARVNTRENVRLTFDQKVETVIQDIVESNFELYKRITDDRAFGEAVKSFLFDQYLRGHRNAEELIKRGESKTLEFKSTLRWSLKESRKDDKGVTHAVLKTIAAFLNTEGGDLLIGVGDDGAVVGIEQDRFESDDKFMLHLAQVVSNGLGDRAGTCIDPKCQVVQGKTVCVVSCQRSPEPVFLKWKGTEPSDDGDFFVRSGPGTVKLSAESAQAYVRTRYGTRVAGSKSDALPKGVV